METRNCILTVVAIFAAFSASAKDENPEDSVPKIYHSILAQKGLPNLLRKNPKPYKKPVFLRLIYNVENVKGYVRPVADYTHTPSMSISTYTYFASSRNLSRWLTKEN